MDHFTFTFTSLFTSLHKQRGRLSTLSDPLLKEIPFYLTFLQKKTPLKYSTCKTSQGVNFIKEIPLKFFRTQKKSTLKLGLENTLQDRQVGNHFFKNSLLVGVFENSWGNSPTCLELYSHKKIVLHFFIPMLL